MSRLFWIGLLGLMFTSIVGAQMEPPFAPGQVSDHVKTVNDASQTYAIYLPTSYDPKKQYPAIYAFDPGGRGVAGVNAYKSAAEKFGYIVIGSNNSKNGLDAPALTTALNALWQDTHNRLSIDDKRVIATGFSGGARVASSLAVACKCIFGVIGDGAGFARGVPTDKSVPFVFAGTIGVDDFNYPELRDLQKKLASSAVPNRTLTFDGGHQWAPEQVASDALEWMEVRETKAGVRPKDDVLLDAALRDLESRGDTFLAAKDYLAAHEAYAAAVADLSGLRDTSSAAKKLSALENSAEYKRAVKFDADAIDKQARLAGEINGLKQGLATADTRTDSLEKIHERVQEMRTHFADAADSPERRLSRRVLNAVFVEAYEAATLRLEPAKNYEMALIELDLAAAVSPKSPEVPYQQARMYALKGDKKKAVQFLTKAVGNGFHDSSRINAETAFEPLRGDADFKAVISGMPN